MILSRAQILLLLDRLKWEPCYEDHAVVLCKKRGIGYGEGEIGKLEAALSMMLQAAKR